MIIDGKAIQNEMKEKLRERVRARKTPPELVIFVVGEDGATASFIEAKKAFADDIRVPFHERRFTQDDAPEHIIDLIRKEAESGNNGIVVQLPLPDAWDTGRVLDAIPVTHDVDVLSSEANGRFTDDEHFPILPPVVGAIKEILSQSGVFVGGGKKVVVLGKGRLVGAPVSVWFARHGSDVTVISRDTRNVGELLREADIIVSGIGVPGFIKPDMIKQGVVLLDAGTKKIGTKIQGDALPACAEKASIFTPTPGGIGPITVAMLFKNLLDLTEKENG